MVVAVDRRDQSLRGRKIDVGRAEVTAGSCCGIEDVLGVRSALANRANRVLPPRRRQELHRPHCAIENGIAVKNAVVGIRNSWILGAVQQRTEDPWIRYS
jgi:hypothetical protein